MTFVRVDLGAPVPLVLCSFQMLGVVHTGRIGHPGANEFVLAVDAHRELVAVMGFAVFLGPTGIQAGPFAVAWRASSRQAWRPDPESLFLPG